MKLENIPQIIVEKNAVLDNIINLNTFTKKIFNNPPKKNQGSRFRRHPFKYGNITVSLTNYDITNDASSRKWTTSVQYGNGSGFPSVNYPNNFFKKIEPIIRKFENGNDFLEIINNGFSEKIASGEMLQKMYEAQISQEPFLEPTELIEEVASIVDRFYSDSDNFCQNTKIIFNHKRIIPKKQMLALYAINKISSIANTK
jgi:DNA (cytosine-5)-methyltransferase 1